jgi:hypothetical protein
MINELKIDEIKLGNLFLLNGFERLYKILCLEVIDESGILSDFSAKIGVMSGYRYDFRPHLTLSYVKNDYILSQNVNYKKTLDVSSVVFKV